MSAALFDTNAAMMVIAGIIKNPALLHDQDNIRLTTDDFANDFYQIVFGSIYNLVMSGQETITPIDIDMNIQMYPQQYEIYKKQNGLDLLKSMSTMHEDTDKHRFLNHYKRLKNFTVLRDLQKNGFSTTQFYNPHVRLEKKDEEERKINEMSPDDIIRAVQGKLNVIEDNYVSRAYATTQKAATGIKDLYFELKANPEIGPPLQGDIMNYLVRGARPGKMYLNSAPTGHGKTRMMVGDAAFLSVPFLDKDGEIIKRKDLHKVLFIVTEQQADEVQTLLISFVSGVNEKKILYGTATPQEEERILKAIDLIEHYEDNFIIEVISDPSIALIRAKSVKHILQNEISFIFYDYIFSSPGLVTEFSSANIREDVALMMLSNTIKEVGATYNVFVGSSTQLNDRWEQSKVRNQNHLRGSKAIADKADVGMITIKLDVLEEEKEAIMKIIADAGLQTPNMVTDIYKNRRGEGAGLKLYRYFDHGTCRMTDIVLTDTNYNIIKDYKAIDYQFERIDLLDLKTGGKANE